MTPSFVTSLLPDPAQDENTTVQNFGDAVDEWRQFIVEITECGVQYVGIAVNSGPSHGTKLEFPYLFHLIACSGVPWRFYFTCAFIAVYASKDLRHFGFRPSQQVLYTAQWYDIKVRDTIYLGLLDDLGGSPNEGFWKWIDPHGYDTTANDVQLVPLQQPDPSEMSHKIDLDSLVSFLPVIKLQSRLLGPSKGYSQEMHNCARLEPTSA